MRREMTSLMFSDLQFAGISCNKICKFAEIFFRAAGLVVKGT